MLLDQHLIRQLHESQRLWMHRQAQVRVYEQMLHRAEWESDGLKQECIETERKLEAMVDERVWVSAEEHGIITRGRELILEQLMQKQELARQLKLKIDKEALEIQRQVSDMQQLRSTLTLLQRHYSHCPVHMEPFTMTIHNGASSVMRWQEYLKRIMHLRSCQKQTLKFPFRHKKRIN